MPDDSLTFYCDSCGKVSKFSRFSSTAESAGFTRSAVLLMWTIPTCFECGSTYGALRPEDTQMAARGIIVLDTMKRFGLLEEARRDD